MAAACLTRQREAGGGFREWLSQMFLVLGGKEQNFAQSIGFACTYPPFLSFAGPHVSRTSAVS